MVLGLGVRRLALLRPGGGVVGVRRLNIHEYQSQEVMAKHGIVVPRGIAAHTVEECVAACDKLAGDEVVVKSQILAGGRGLGTFTNGFKGGVHIVPKAQVADVASKMLGQTLVTKQSGPEGKPVSTLFVCEKLKLTREMYMAIMLDRVTKGPLIIASAEGGTSIEDLAKTNPEKIIKIPINPEVGMTEAQAKDLHVRLKIEAPATQSVPQLLKLYDLFDKTDATMLEINPFGETAEGVICADAKLNFDDNAAFRQKEIFAMRDKSQEDPREARASEFDLNYIGLDGNIGCMVNGAGLAMATMDIIKLKGGTPANFLDVGGAANTTQITEAFKILTADKRVKAILVNIFGGIMKCDVIAQGIVDAAKTVGVPVPLVVRLEGTNVDAGKKILRESPVKIIDASDLDDAAQKAVAAIK